MDRTDRIKGEFEDNLIKEFNIQKRKQGQESHEMMMMRPPTGVHVCSGAPSCPTLCDSMECSPPGSSVHGIILARILEQVVISFSKGIFLTQGLNLCFLYLLALTGIFFTTEPPEKPRWRVREYQFIFFFYKQPFLSMCLCLFSF